jgi:hypothetical protein
MVHGQIKPSAQSPCWLVPTVIPYTRSWSPSRSRSPRAARAVEVSLAVLTVSGYIGGKLAFRYGVRVADEHTQAEGYVPDSDEAWQAH